MRAPQTARASFPHARSVGKRVPRCGETCTSPEPRRPAHRPVPPARPSRRKPDLRARRTAEPRRGSRELTRNRTRAGNPDMAVEVQSVRTCRMPLTRFQPEMCHGKTSLPKNLIQHRTSVDRERGQNGEGNDVDKDSNNERGSREDTRAAGTAGERSFTPTAELRRARCRLCIGVSPAPETAPARSRALGDVC